VILAHVAMMDYTQKINPAGASGGKGQVTSRVVWFRMVIGSFIGVQKWLQTISTVLPATRLCSMASHAFAACV
jgi:hypothetical protein